MQDALIWFREPCDRKRDTYVTKRPGLFALHVAVAKSRLGPSRDFIHLRHAFSSLSEINNPGGNLTLVNMLVPIARLRDQAAGPDVIRLKFMLKFIGYPINLSEPKSRKTHSADPLGFPPLG
jgi:hypothetical protein